MRKLIDNTIDTVVEHELGVWPTSCSIAGMTYTTLLNRVRADFVEMPGLELTVTQAVRLWNMGADDCRSVLDALVDAGFLKWTAGRTVVRTGRELGAVLEPAYVPVRTPQNADKSVAR